MTTFTDSRTRNADPTGAREAADTVVRALAARTSNDKGAGQVTVAGRSGAADPRLVVASPHDGWYLALFDLNGFERYNDAFGDRADALLARLGAALETAADRRGGIACPLGSAATYDRGSTVAAQTRDALMQALREREPELGDHVRHVADLAVAVGRQLGMDAEQLDELHRAAELHDVGKIATPDAVLHKPGKLDDDDWRLMKEHTIIGERILDSVPALRPVARIVRSSHEHWDGSGYPDALRGAEIPLGSRIVLVCDAFSAMTSTRSYRAAMSVEDAVTELVRYSGEQFDPAVVDAFVKQLGFTVGDWAASSAPECSAEGPITPPTCTAMQPARGCSSATRA